MPKEVVVRIAKDNSNALIAPPTDLLFSSEFDTMKIKLALPITFNVPANTVLATDPVEVQSQGYNHGLGYVPFITPELGGIENPDPFGGDPFDMNDNLVRVPLGGPYGPPIAGAEYCSVFATSTQIVLEVIQLGDTLFETDDVVFPAHIVTANVILYYNRVDEVVDYT